MMPQRYAAETKILAGHFVNHDDNMEDNELAKDLELTETLWEEAYGVPYLDKQQQHQQQQTNKNNLGGVAGGLLLLTSLAAVSLLGRTSSLTTTPQAATSSQQTVEASAAHRQLQGSCVNSWETARSGREGACERMLLQGMTCEGDFCSTCDLPNYCDETCNMCGGHVTVVMDAASDSDTDQPLVEVILIWVIGGFCISIPFWRPCAIEAGRCCWCLDWNHDGGRLGHDDGGRSLNRGTGGTKPDYGGCSNSGGGCGSGDSGGCGSGGCGS